ncbi:helix-turn-helix domain-containing protein [Olsenella sp. AM39-30AC]|uniref:helix-turn-helix domain-containing protein n=1 Tax=Olsenella sp. AM39-30AC TaxID=2292360 RepID=UPI0025709C4A|nr:helix-turn-helix domain-containing protein [Olsenella sp. AM39-30AC]
MIDGMDGMRLRELRHGSGKTLRQVSIESGVTENQILSIETGRTENPGIVTLAAIASAIGCKVGDFVRDGDS